MSVATPENVRTELDTDLDDLEIADILDRAARDIDREYTADDFEDVSHRRDFEALLASVRIAGGRDRRARSASSESSSATFEIAEIETLSARLARLDPGTAFSRDAFSIDADRHVRSANNGGDAR